MESQHLIQFNGYDTHFGREFLLHHKGGNQRILIFTDIYICILTQTLFNGQDVTQGQFLAEYFLFEFRVVLLLHWVPNEDKETLSAQVFTNSLGDNGQTRESL